MEFLTALIMAVLSILLPTCEEEDGSGGPVPCYWDASQNGNGQGNDYIVTDN